MKILPAASGCNTSSMTRVVDGGALIAMFLSYNDAVAYIETKQAARNAKPLTGDGFVKHGQRPLR